MKPERHSRILIGYNQFLNGESVASRARFNLSSFEDFNKLVEAVILYDRVVLLGDYPLPDGPISSVLKKEQVIDTLTDVALRDIIARPEVTRTFTESIRYAFGEEAANAEDAQPSHLISNRNSPNRFDQLSYNALYEEVVQFGTQDRASIDALRGWLKEHIYATRGQGAHFSYVARSLIYSAVADHTGMDYAPDFLRLPLAAMSFGRSHEIVPKKLYDALCKKLESEIEALVILGMPVAVFIPPTHSEASRPSGRCRQASSRTMGTSPGVCEHPNFLQRLHRSPFGSHGFHPRKDQCSPEAVPGHHRNDGTKRRGGRTEPESVMGQACRRGGGCGWRIQ